VCVCVCVWAGKFDGITEFCRNGAASSSFLIPAENSHRMPDNGRLRMRTVDARQRRGWGWGKVSKAWESRVIWSADVAPKDGEVECVDVNEFLQAGSWRRRCKTISRAVPDSRRPPIRLKPVHVSKIPNQMLSIVIRNMVHDCIDTVRTKNSVPSHYFTVRISFDIVSRCFETLVLSAPSVGNFPLKWISCIRNKRMWTELAIMLNVWKLMFDPLTKFHRTARSHDGFYLPSANNSCSNGTCIWFSKSFDS
jgi:hypothetical protein